jgi:hypothetical protein
MNAHQDAEPIGFPCPLEAIEFELALSAENILERGFEAVVCSALEKTGGTLLFLMPVSQLAEWQRVAAVSVGDDPESHTLLVLLHEDGASHSVESAAACGLEPYASVALSFRNVLERLAEPAASTSH